MATPGAPGIQAPQNYPVNVGPKYLYWGEQPGWIYNPYTDTYEPDPEQAQAWGEQVGLIEAEPEPPGLVEQLAPVAAGAGAIYGGRYIAEKGLPAVTEQLGELIPSFGGTGASQAGSSLAAPEIVGASRIPGSAASTGASTGTTGAGMFSPSGIGSAGNMILPIAGGFGVYDLATNDRGPVGGALQGAASGAAIGSGFAGVGAVPGAIIGGTLGLAKGLFGERETGREKMQKRINSLLEQGVNLPDFVQQNPADYGLEKEDLVAREQAKFDQSGGAFGNPTFARTRDEKDLRATDTWGGLMWFEEFGNDYLGATTEEQRRLMNERALNEGIINEARGQLSFKDKAKAREIWNEVTGGAEQPNQAVTREIVPGQERTSTLSPGIGLDGRPISRGMM